MNAMPDPKPKFDPARPGIDQELAQAVDIRQIKELVDDAINHRKQLRLGKQDLTRTWNEASSAYNGRQWRIGPWTRQDFEDIVINKTLWATDATVAELANTVPTTTVIADASGFDPQKLANAEAIDRIRDDQYQAVEMHEVLEDAVRKMVLMGTSALHDGWDPLKESGSGVGNCTLEAVSPHNLVVDPNVEDHQQGEFCGVRHWKSFAYMRRRWPWLTDELIKNHVAAEQQESLEDAKEIKLKPPPKGLVPNTLAWGMHFIDKLGFGSGRQSGAEATAGLGAYVNIVYYRHTEIEYQSIPVPFMEEQYPDAEAENKSMLSGQDEQIGENEDHRIHIEAHTAAYQAIMQIIHQSQAQNQPVSPQMLMAAGKLMVHLKAHQLAASSMTWEIMKPVNKYPGGVRIVYAGDLLLEIGPNETAEHKFPISVMRLFKRPNEFWGMGIYEAWRDLFKLYNKGASQFVEFVNKRVNPDKLIEERMVPNKGDFEKMQKIRPGSMKVVPNNTAKRGEGWDWMHSADMELNTLLQFIQWVNGEITTNTRLHPATMGQAVPSVTSGDQLERLQESAHSGLALVEKNVHKALAETTRRMIVNSLRNWTADRKMRRLEQRGEQAMIVYYHPPFIVPDPDGQGQTIPRVPMLEFVVDIVPGSGSRSFRERKQMRALQLFQLGAVDVVYLLSAMDDPELADVIKRRDQTAQLQQAASELQNELKRTEDELRKTYSNLQKAELNEVVWKQKEAIYQSWRSSAFNLLFKVKTDPLKEAVGIMNGGADGNRRPETKKDKKLS